MLEVKGKKPNDKSGNEHKIEKEDATCSKVTFYPLYGSMLRFGRASWQLMRMIYG